MKGTHISYTAEELAWIKANRSMLRRHAHETFCVEFGRTDVSFDNFKALCTRNGWKTGRTGCFPGGHVPDNKGRKMPHNAKRAETQFKKGQLPHNTKFVDHERVSKDGYVEISIERINPYTGYERRYVLKHKYLWEQKNGSVPKGMCLKCLDGNRQNTDLSNWELIQRGALPFMNGWRGIDYETAEPDMKPLVLTLAKLKEARSRKARRKTVPKVAAIELL